MMSLTAFLKMKILQLGKFYPIRGGVEKVMWDLTRGLSERGTDCDMLCAELGIREPHIIQMNAHSMSQSVPRSERPRVRSHMTFSTPPRMG